MNEQSNNATKIQSQWLTLGVVALAIAGLFSLVLVVSRTPQLNANPVFSKLFHEALVVHVDLSVLVWFFAMAGFVMAAQIKSFIVKLCLYLTYSAIALIAFSPFDISAEALMSNYIPVITSKAFFVGLFALFIAVFVFSLAVLFEKRKPLEDFESWCARGLALIFLMSLSGFFTAYLKIPETIEGEQYYEYLFWSGGHIMQFAFSALLMFSWVKLFAAVKPDLLLNPRFLGWLFLLNTAVASVGLLGFLYEPYTMEYRDFYTNHMIMAGSIAPVLLLAYFAKRFFYSKTMVNSELKTSLYISILLFIYGGVLALLISGQDARIPAHYHGAIVAITIALMGFAYLCTGAKGRMVKWQPVVYGFGQALHISGLAYSGGYGALRKTPGAEGLSVDAVVALGMMGLGGLLAIIGGFIFVVVMFLSIKAKTNVIQAPH